MFGRGGDRQMKQIIAMGGGGFSMEPENPLLDQYVLAQTAKERPKVCFIPTASGDDEGYVNRFYESFRQHDCEAVHLPLFKTRITDLESFVLAQDVIYVGGGNSRNLLALWREWGLDAILRKAWQRGVILAGVSAGAICWFAEGLTDSFNIDAPPRPINCLGLLPGSCCPHYDGEATRRPTYHELVASGQLAEGLALDDGAAVHIVDTDLRAAIASRPEARVYRVQKAAGVAMETVLDTVFLGRP